MKTKSGSPITAAQKAAYAKLRSHALSYPGSFEDFPWGHCAVKVKGKVFVFLVHGEMEDSGGAAVGLSLKLPLSNGQALSLPFCTPTGYGLGKAGWVSASFSVDDDVPVDILTRWIDESYRAVAPKTLLKQLDGGGVTTSITAQPSTKAAAPPPATKKRAAQKAPKKSVAKKAAPPKKGAAKKVVKKTATKKTALKKAG